MNEKHVVFPDMMSSGQPLDLAFPPSASPTRSVPEPTSDDASFLRWLLFQAELDSHDYCDATLKRRLPACLRSLGAGTLGQARVLLRRRPEIVPMAVSALTLGVTSFFRDAPVFEALRRDVLTPLAQCGRRLNVCSAGCSNGAELYSIAILLDRLGVLHRACLLGVDCRREAVSRASAGHFDANDLIGVDDQTVKRYFERREKGLQVCAGLRAATQWERADLLRAPLGGPFDLIACRNMAIYLRPAARDRLWRKLADHLRPGGVLMVGKAERPALPQLQPLALCLYRKSDAM